MKYEITKLIIKISTIYLRVYNIMFPLSPSCQAYLEKKTLDLKGRLIEKGEGRHQKREKDIYL